MESKVRRGCWRCNDTSGGVATRLVGDDTAGGVATCPKAMQEVWRLRNVWAGGDAPGGCCGKKEAVESHTVTLQCLFPLRIWISKKHCMYSKKAR